jgi:hypothetical protein
MSARHRLPGHQSGGLISKEAASAYMLRQWLARDAEILAQLVHFHYYTPRQALADLQALGRIADRLCRRLDCSADRVCADMLVEAVQRQQLIHAETAREIEAAVIAARQAGESGAEIANLVQRIIDAAETPPPRSVVSRAVNFAIRPPKPSHRRSA